jgi:hypothetical protein
MMISKDKYGITPIYFKKMIKIKLKRRKIKPEIKTKRKQHQITLTTKIHTITKIIW